MWTVLSLNIFVVFIAYLAKYKQFKYGLELSFIAITSFLVIRYDYGNDYISYLNMFKSINEFLSIDLSTDSKDLEFGWVILNRLFSDFGFFALVGFLTIFQHIVYYFLIKKNVPKEMYWFAVFIYVFSPGFMLTQASMMRQALSISLFIISINFLLKKQYLRYLLIILFASFFHRSALFLLPLVVFCFVNFRLNKFAISLTLLLFGSLFFFKTWYEDILNLIINTSFEKYEVYLGDTVTMGAGLGFIFLVILFLLILFNEKKQSKDISLFFKLSILGFLFIPLGFIVQLIGRVGMYFSIVNIIVFPYLILNISKPIIKYGLLILILLITFWDFYLFFNSPIWKEKFGTYQTIFSAPYLN